MRADSAIFGVNSGAVRQWAVAVKFHYFFRAPSAEIYTGSVSLWNRTVIIIKWGVNVSGPGSLHSEFTVRSL